MEDAESVARIKIQHDLAAIFITPGVVERHVEVVG